MASKLARMAADDDRATDPASGPAQSAPPKARGDLGPLILALTRAVDRQALDRAKAPEASHRG